MIKPRWKGKFSRVEAIRILDRTTDKDDPFWQYTVEDYYDEESDTLPTIQDVFIALGVTRDEFAEATGADNFYWPDEVDTHE